MELRGNFDSSSIAWARLRSSERTDALSRTAGPARVRGYLGALMLGASILTAIGLVAVSLAGIAVRPIDAVLVLLLVTLLAATTFGLRAGVASALISVILLDFFFFDPLFTFAVYDKQHIAALALFL